MAVAMIGPKFYAWDRNGKPLAFGKLFTYQARTNVPKPTYQSEDQVVENTNPVILNGEGYANIYLDGSYKMVLKDDKDNEIWSSDPVTANQAKEWVNCFPAEYISHDSLKIAGNQTGEYRIGRKVRVDNGTSTYSYSQISSSSYAGGETSVVLSDSIVTTGIDSVCTSITSSDSSFSSYDVGLFSDYVAENIDDMLLGKTIGGTIVDLIDGQQWSSGGTTWRVNGSPSSATINDFTPLTSVNLFDFGAKGDGLTNDTEALQTAIDSVDVLYIPKGNFLLNGMITVPSNKVIFGDGVNSKFVIKDEYDGTIFKLLDGTENVTFSKIHIDGSSNYPVDYTVYRGDILYNNSAIILDGGFNEILIDGCFFTKVSYTSIRANGLSGKKLTISNNVFNDGNYGFKAVAIYSVDYDADTRHTLVTITGNTFTGGGPLYWYDPSKDDYCTSVDCCHVDGVKSSKITNNTFYNVGGIAIRVEESIYSVVSNNTIDGCGFEGITVYKDCFYVSVVNNSVDNYGITIPYRSLRKYNGLYYFAKEFPDVSDAPLPADPSSSSWFEENPYYLQNVDESKILDYADTQYYPATDGILPFRGFGGISITQQSAAISVSNNVIKGDTTSIGGKLVKACDFGVSYVAISNGPSGSFVDKNICSNNTLSSYRLYAIYHPEYIDPINENGLLGVINASENTADAAQWWRECLIFKNSSPTYEVGNYNAPLTPESGSITMNGAYDTLSYARTGDVVHIFGQIYVSSVNAPGGALTIPLPFKMINLPERSDRFIGSAKMSSATTPDLVYDITANFENTDYATISVTPAQSAAALVQSGTSIVIGLAYKTLQDQFFL